MTQTQTAPILEKSSRSEAGKYLTFSVNDVTYGAAILQVREIIGAMEITSLPRAPEYVLGVINLRDEIIPVMDLRQRFGLAAGENQAKNCTIVVEVRTDGQTRRVGLNVDRVSDVLEVSAEQIEETPAIGISAGQGFVAGMAKVATEVVILLDIDRLLANQAAVTEPLAEAVAA